MISRTITIAPLRQAFNASERASASLERLSSGLRVNRASDDAAGLSISEKLRSQVMGLSQAGRNIQDAINVVRIGEQGVQGLLDPLQRMRELAVQAGNATNSPNQLQAIQSEIDELKQLVITAYQIAQKADMDIGGPPGSRILTFQVGANKGDTITFDYTGLCNTMFKATAQLFGYQELYNSPLQPVLAFQLGGFAPPPSAATQILVPKVVDVTVPGGPGKALQAIDAFLNGSPSVPALGLPATNGLLVEMGRLGALENQLQHTYNVAMIGQENQAAAESRIRDLDMASEMTEFTRNQVLQRSAIAMVSQANLHLSRIKDLVGA